MRALLLLLALLLLVAAAVAAVTNAGALGAAWFRADPGSLNTLQAGVQRYIAPGLWTFAFVPVLRQPAWLVASLAACVAGALALAWRRR